MTTKQRMNAKVAKLVVGQPVQWSASGIGTVALDNAYEAGHIIMVDTGDANEYWIVRPTAEQLAAATVNAWGKLTYTLPAAQPEPTERSHEALEIETVSQEEATMITNTPAERADAALQAFIGTAAADYNDTAEQLADLIASSHHLARRLGLDWKSILGDATKRYADTKEAKPTVAKANAKKSGKASKQPKAASSPAVLWTLEVELPSGVIANAQRAKPYSHAALICVAGEWSVFAWVSSKETASKRIGDAKRSGIVVEAYKVAEVRIVDAPAPSFESDRAIAQQRAAEPLDDQQEEQEAEARLVDDEPTADDPYQIEQTALGQAIITGDWPRTEDMIGLPFEPAEANEIEREVEIDEPMQVKIKGGTATHYSDEGEETYCGIQRDDMRQVEATVDCRSCIKVAGSRAAKA